MIRKKVLAVITARGGSKGIPRKNLVECGGKPLIAWCIEAGSASEFIDRMVVSTDDPEIAETARACGAEVPFLRPAEMSGDASPHVLAVRHAVEQMRDINGETYDYTLLLQPTSPLILSCDIDGAVGLALSREADSVIAVHPAQEHPYYTRVFAEDGRVDYMMREGINVARRQNLPAAYAQSGAIYVIRTSLMFEQNLLETERPLAYVIPVDRALDVDSPWDMYLADLILRDRNPNVL